MRTRTSNNGITQLFPGVALSFAPRQPSAMGVAAGIVAGIAALAAFAIAHTSIVAGINVGLVALALNAAVVLAFGYVRSPVRSVENR